LRATGAAMGICTGKNLFCAQPEPALSLDAIAACETPEQMAQLIKSALGRPRVRTSIEKGKELPFVLVQPTRHNQIIPDQLVSISFKREAIERTIDRGAPGLKNNRKIRRIKRKKKRRRR
jgi:hypothetical protein